MILIPGGGLARGWNYPEYSPGGMPELFGRLIFPAPCDMLTRMNVVRRAIPRDIPRILELYEELMEEKQNVSGDTLRKVFDEATALPGQFFLVAEKDGFVAGTLFVQIIPNLSHDARPWGAMENMVVDRRYHRQGIGRLLMEYALDRCREAGCFKVQLLSHKKRLVAHRFYRDLGFEESALGFRLYF
jgi:GNAT superfamily N-acetyltransferase